MVRSLKSSFLPISRIPPEVLSLIPDYCEEEYVDRASITLTHVCRRWREAFISRSTLWTHLDCMDVDKTRTYIQRSKSSPLRIFIFDTWGKRCPNHAFSLVIPHISRIRSLMILAGAIPDLLRHFRCHPPLLEELDINITLLPTLTIDNAMFGGDLSPLRRLTLIGVVTHLPWRNMANLTVFKLHCPLMYEVAVTRILDFFESVPPQHSRRYKFNSRFIRCSARANCVPAPPQNSLHRNGSSTFDLKSPSYPHRCIIEGVDYLR